MRLLPFLLLFGPLLTFSAAAQVDTLRHKSSIEAFVKTKGNYASAELQEVNQVFRDSVLVSAAVPAYWLRGDFNHDGVADLLVQVNVSKPLGQQPERMYSDELLMVLTGGTAPSLVNLDNEAYKGAFISHITARTAAPVTVAQRTYLVYSLLLTRTINQRDVRRLTHDTVFVQDNQPMLYHMHLFPTASVKSIRYATEGFWGPRFQVQIQNDGQVLYHGEAKVKPRGYRWRRISPEDYRYLTDLLRHLNLPQLADEYAVHWSDAQGCSLRVEWADGRTKSIDDYGMQGTYGLAILYQFFWRKYQPR